MVVHNSKTWIYPQLFLSSISYIFLSIKLPIKSLEPRIYTYIHIYGYIGNEFLTWGPNCKLHADELHGDHALTC